MSSKETKQRIYVFADWREIGKPTLMGILISERLKGKEIFSFEYDDDWLKSKYAMQLDPDLELYSGKHYLNDEKPNFGLFLDSSPDRWGQVLMRRREALMARLEKRKEVSLFQTDYLLGVYDGQRMGALRFKTDLEGNFLNDNNLRATPPWTSIRELEQISLKIEEKDSVNDPAYEKWLGMLIAPGSSLGGARPKASVLDENGNLWIAKFPSRNDQSDMGAWEKVTYDLAIASGINMARSQAQKYSSKHHTFLTKRFDRTEKGERIHFASAMTMLGYSDGENYQQGISYLELVEFITNNGSNVKEDLEELFRRIVFSICVSNTDDHLRNHGFILTDRGWSLSPAYDINPNESGKGLSLNISENDNSLDLDLPLHVCEYFRLTEKQALKTIETIKGVVSTWKNNAKKYGISNTEQELMARAFTNF
ncbi:MAG: type II toxin-antitoxin system HipA family toxin [Cyclobacteriaceae bacterium]|nr:type II toxin-antitoxin system HipA family toxin [Cyclobacteriaceae bacterium]